MPFERSENGDDAAVDLRARRELRAPSDAHGDAVRRDLDAIALDGSNALDREFERGEARESNVSDF